jgi:hypothetical protein
MLFSKAFLWASGFTTGAIAVPAPGPCSGSCGTHDPALIRRVSDGTYFRFSTNGHVGTASAPSISGPWTSRGAALPGTLKLSQGSDIWVAMPSKNVLKDIILRGVRLRMSPLLVALTICIMPSVRLGPRTRVSAWRHRQLWSRDHGLTTAASGSIQALGTLTILSIQIS